MEGTTPPTGPPSGPPSGPPQGPVGPPAGPAGPPPIAGPPASPIPNQSYVAASAPPSRGSGAAIPLVLALIGLIVSAGAVVFTRSQNPSSSQAAGGGELFLEAAASPGINPFTDPVDPEPTTTTLAKASSTTAQLTSTTAAGGPSTTTATAPPSTVAVQPTSGAAPPPGSPPYGGTGDDTKCDQEKLVAFLTANADRASAWSGVLNVPVADIATFVRGLKPTQLLYDTRVTNHGFANGKATKLQSVLQAGTAVLIDAKGNPVVRCRCGNPLLAPAPLTNPTPVNPPWPGYEPNATVAVNNGQTAAPPVNEGQGQTSSTPTTTPVSSSTSVGESTITTRGSTPSSPPSSGPDFGKLLDQLRVCGGEAEVVSAKPTADLANIYIVLINFKGDELQFSYDSDTGSVIAGSQLTSQVMADCGITP